jgi:hypothetical protein
MRKSDGACGPGTGNDGGGDGQVKAFVDQHGRRPQLAEISSDADWKALHDELNTLWTRDGKPTHIKDERGERVKRGSVMCVERPAPLPVVPEGIKDGRPADCEASGEAMALPSALHLCFPDLFLTMTCARRSARCGGDPRIYRVPPGGHGLFERGRGDFRKGTLLPGP